MREVTHVPLITRQEMAQINRECRQEDILDEAVQAFDGPGPEFLAGYLVGRRIAKTYEEGRAIVNRWASHKE